MQDIASAQKYSRDGRISKGKVMKNVSVLTILGIVLCALVFWLAGCGYTTQSGETAVEGQRRHLRNLSVNQQSLMSDIDRAMLFDRPTKLTDKRIY